MALSPKSNSTYLAMDAALNDIHKGNFGSVPDQIRINTTTYLYPHDYPNDYVKQEYMPDKLIGKKYYQPKNNKVEQNLNIVHQNMINNKK